MQTIFFIHGRGPKPLEIDLSRIWHETVRWGIERDRPEKLDSFDAVEKKFLYYGDLSNQILGKCANDVFLREEALEKLKFFKGDEFTHWNYCKNKGKNIWVVLEYLFDIFSSIISKIRIAKQGIELSLPDFKEYWQGESNFRKDLWTRITMPIVDAMLKDQQIMIVTHSLGCIFTWDAAWILSAAVSGKIDTWITVGCPLGDSIIKNNLLGIPNGPLPNNINRWVNIAAHDDYIAHEQSLNKIFPTMNIQDNRIYNLAMWKKLSDPHLDLGYLIHPTFTATLTDWLVCCDQRTQ